VETRDKKNSFFYTSRKLGKEGISKRKRISYCGASAACEARKGRT